MSRSLLLPAVLLAVLLAGCTSGERPPRTDLSPGVLEEALIETHLALARALRTGEPPDSLRAVAFERLGVDSLAVARALDAYADRPEALSALYGRVIDRLSDELLDGDPLLSDPVLAPSETSSPEAAGSKSGFH